VTFTFAVSSTIGTPGGSVTLSSGNVPVATAPLVDGQAVFSLSSLNAGTHLLAAQYAGAGGFAASDSPTMTHSVARATTATVLRSSANPSRTGQAVTFTATVNPVAPGGGVPTGSVEFLRDGVVLGTRPVVNGMAQWTTSALTAGKHVIHARYTGTSNYTASTSVAFQQSVKGGGK
jgi:hypothetical protein